jgi:hypothetical protein
MIDLRDWLIEQEEVHRNEVRSPCGCNSVPEVGTWDICHFVIESKSNALMQAGKPVADWSPSEVFCEAARHPVFHSVSHSGHPRSRRMGVRASLDAVDRVS